MNGGVIRTPALYSWDHSDVRMNVRWSGEAADSVLWADRKNAIGPAHDACQRWILLTGGYAL